MSKDELTENELVNLSDPRGREWWLLQHLKSILALVSHWSLASWLPKLMFHAIAPWTTCANWHQNHAFISKYCLHKFGNK